MTRISDKAVDTEIDQGFVTIYTSGSERARFAGTGVAIYAVSATDQSGVRIVGITGGTAAVSSATAASASGGTSGMSAINIPHGLAAAPTNFGVQPGNARSAILQSIGGYYMTADATNVNIFPTTALSASDVYVWQWWASP